MANSRIRYLIGNWKMNLLTADAKSLVRELGESVKRASQTQVYVCPPFTALSSLQDLCREYRIGLGAQNVHWENEGAFTGDISAPMLQDLGCSLSLVGHSERRKVFKESDSECAARARHALSSGLKAVFCIGEELEARNAGTTAEVVSRQLSPLFEHPFPSEQLLLAYEPVWAIGGKASATFAQIKETHSQIEEAWKRKAASTRCPPILYGGSVTPHNFAEILSCPLVAGALVGRASIGAASFLQLIEIAEKAPLI